MEEYAVVERTDTRGGGTVAVEKNAACGGCKACSFEGDGKSRFAVADLKGAVAGDRVRIRIAQGSRARAAMWVYAFPLLLLVVGFVAGYIASGRVDWIGLVSGAGLMLVGSVALYFVNKRYQTKQAPPEILEVIQATPTEDTQHG
jgi:positive regulator of sigma E activity